MKSQTMTAAEFRAQLKSLNLNQSSFAACAEVPLRTVQSWALGERRIPGTARALLEKVERMSTKGKIVAIAQTLPEKKQKMLVDILEVMGRQAKEVSALRDELQELRGTVSKLEGDQRELRETCVFQAKKLKNYEQELEKRVAGIVPFNT